MLQTARAYAERAGRGDFIAVVGGPLVVISRWDSGRALTRMAVNHARWTLCRPSMADEMGAAAAEGARSIPGFRSITVVGAYRGTERGVLARAEQALGTKILRGYGTSEFLGPISPRPEDPEAIRLGRDGRPVPGTEVRAVAPDGAVLGPGVIGRAEVRGPSLLLGHAHDGKTEPPVLSEDGFFATGDLLMTSEEGTVTVAAGAG